MDEAFVLHRWPFQESSLIVELFTRQHGRLRLLAKGAKRGKQQWASILQAYVPLHYECRGRGDLPKLTALESPGISSPLQGSFLFCGFYMNELMQRLTPERAPLPALFDDYQETLNLLRQQVSMEPVLRKFEWLLLSHLELDFPWDIEIGHGHAIVANQFYRFIPGQGFVEATGEATEQLSASAIESIYSGATLQKLAAFELTSTPLLKAFKALMRQAIAVHLGNKPLRSRELFQGQLKN